MYCTDSSFYLSYFVQMLCGTTEKRVAPPIAYTLQPFHNTTLCSVFHDTIASFRDTASGSRRRHHQGLPLNPHVCMDRRP